MPIYEYQCKYCDAEIEKMQKINDEPLIMCPKCENPYLKRIVSKTSFKLKGKGWYETDFKN